MNLPPFRNEPYADFTKPDVRKTQQEAIEAVRAQLGQEYDLRIAGERVRTGNLLKSVNPSRPSEVVGLHHKADADLARKSVEKAVEAFPKWSHTLAEDRVRMLVRAAELIRKRKFEFNAWLAFEAGKTWPMGFRL